MAQRKKVVVTYTPEEVKQQLDAQLEWLKPPEKPQMFVFFHPNDQHQGGRFPANSRTTIGCGAGNCFWILSNAAQTSGAGSGYVIHVYPSRAQIDALVASLLKMREEMSE